MVELLIVTAIIGVLMGAVFMIFFGANSTFRTETEQAARLQSMRIAMSQITRTIRQAGNDPLRELEESAIAISGGNSIVLRSDITGSVAASGSNSAEGRGDPDGETDSIFEVVTFRHDPGGAVVYSNIGYGEAVLIEGIRDLNFTGYNLAGVEVSDPAQIARVKVVMVANPTAAAVNYGNSLTSTIVSDVYIRSRTPQIAP